MEEGAERSIHRGPEAAASCSQSYRQRPCRRGGTVQTTAYTPQQQRPVSLLSFAPTPRRNHASFYTCRHCTTCFSLPFILATTNKASKCLMTVLHVVALEFSLTMTLISSIQHTHIYPTNRLVHRGSCCFWTTMKNQC